MRNKESGEKPKQVVNEYVEPKSTPSYRGKKPKSNQKKPIYKRTWFIVVMVLLVLCVISPAVSPDEDIDNNTAKNNTQQEEQVKKQDEQKAEKENKDDSEKSSTKKEKQKTPLESADEMGQYWFTHVDWNSVFPYGCDVHSVMGYSCSEVKKEYSKYGKYVARAKADIKNQYGSEFKSTIYIFMDKNGVAKSVYYDEVDGTSVEIPMDSIQMSSY